MPGGPSTIAAQTIETMLNNNAQAHPVQIPATIIIAPIHWVPVSCPPARLRMESCISLKPAAPPSFIWCSGQMAITLLGFRFRSGEISQRKLEGEFFISIETAGIDWFPLRHEVHVFRSRFT
ncbi:hypothetical protein KSP39_PZI012535 [Platanthera zijinensis]|uniref:Uncharacterized protein n=1 Tax=Platanthera zijinensis TaxID=2320716 RepID=A0AAP0BEU0_9ASPA